MNRREMLQGAGLVALAGVAANTFAEDHSKHAGMSGMGIAQSAGDCVRTGEACLAHCIEMMGGGNAEMADCAKSVNQLIALCAALQSLANQSSPHTGKLAKVSMQVCKECQKECEKFPKHEVCKACAEACASCYKECEKIAV